MKVFLGGTCGKSIWRDELIQMLCIDYFNPQLPEGTWNDAAYEEELKQRKECDYCLYVITSEEDNIYSVAEVVDDSNKRPEKTIFCFLGFEIGSHKFKAMTKVAKMVQNNGGNSFISLPSVAIHLNSL